MSTQGHWYYESDGDAHNRTHYVRRYMDAAKGGIERKDFATKKDAFAFLDRNTPFVFTDNRGANDHRHTVILSAEQVAKHLLSDQQFAFYWRKGWDWQLAATRSLYAYPPHKKAIICQTPTSEQWRSLEQALTASDGTTR